MSIWKQFLSSAESLITRTVVQKKVKGFIKDLSASSEQQNSELNKMQEQVEDSTGLAGEIVDDMFKLFAKGFKGLTNNVVISVCDNEEAIVNLISNNSTAIVQLAKAIKSLNTDINKQSVMAIYSNFKESGTDYLNEEFAPKMEAQYNATIEPNIKDIGSIWGVEMKYYMLEFNFTSGKVESVRCTKDCYDKHKDSYKKEHGKFDEQVSMFTTRQTSCIHPKK